MPVPGTSCHLKLRKFYEQLITNSLIHELIVINKLAWPCVISSVTGQMFPFVTLLFAGHIGTGVYFDGTGIALSFANVTGTSIVIGFSSGMDTLCSQAYGGKNYRLVGVYFQRAIILSLLVCFPIWALWLNAESILILLHQDVEVAAIAGKYLRILCVAKPAVMIYLLANKFMQTQNIVNPCLFLNSIATVVNISCQYLFVVHLGFGVEGSAISLSISYWSLAILYVMYIRCSSLYHTSWQGWSSDALNDWLHYCKYGIPGLIMLCLEWWTYEIGFLVIGGTSAYPKVEIGIYSIMFNVSAQLFMVPLGFTIAATVRVGNLLGANKPYLARKVAYLCLGIILVIGVLFSTGVFILKSRIPLLFTTDACIIAGATQTLFLTAIYVNFDGLRLLSGGILKGCGRQNIGSIANFVVYQFFAVPLAICLSVVLKLATRGYWIGLASAIFVQAALFFLLVVCTNWRKVADIAMINVGLSEPQLFNGNSLSSLECSESSSLLPNEIKQKWRMPSKISYQELIKICICLLFLAFFAVGLGFSFKKSSSNFISYPNIVYNSTHNSTDVICPY
ncbi:Multidrug and toxin extrusion protein 1-like [Oopsacas minuta]|uniref:Multidrug and toxin extrusion protein n=1 Tax=Oopsacas minuta TaxID=111878 RepID=A0AAV7JI62_9METZ|nr:Multidrug and toxin extrusion protein 1-like [Oopsacas minuta]